MLFVNIITKCHRYVNMLALKETRGVKDGSIECARMVTCAMLKTMLSRIEQNLSEQLYDVGAGEIQDHQDGGCSCTFLS